MKGLPYGLAAIGVATVLFASIGSIAQTPNSLDHLLWDTSLDFLNCSTVFGTAEIISDTIGYGPDSPKAKEAYKQFYEHRDNAERNGEARFAAIKQELASKEAAEVALKELYIYWRTEMASCSSHEKYDVVHQKFRSLLERVRVEANW